MRILHVTHNDMDAVGCDVIVRIYCKENLGIDPSSDEIKTCWCTATGASDVIIKEIEAIRCNAQQRMPTNIFISDISITEECAKMLEKLSEMYGFEVKLFDHHATNKLSEIFPWCKVVLSSPPISATMILRNELLGSIDADKYPGIDEFCDKVSRYDTWMWKKNPRDYSEEDYNTLCKFYGAASYSKRIVDSGFNFSIENFDKLVVDKFKEKSDADVLKYTNESRLAFVKDGDLMIAYALYSGDFGNAVMEAIYENYPQVDIVANILPASRQISFRTNKQHVNVGEYAKKNYGGGGHPSAAGAMWIEMDIYLECLKTFYENVGKGIQ